MVEGQSAALTPTPGWAIVLNGASSSGKTSIAKALQAMFPSPPLCMSSDHLLEGMLPKRWDGDSPHDWWREMREPFFRGFHMSIASYVEAGNNVIVDHLLEFPDWRGDLGCFLTGDDVFLVGVHCDVDEIDRREQQRGDRMVGEGRTHVEVDRVHSFGPYDFEVDTTARPAADVAAQVFEAWNSRRTSVLDA